MIDGWRYYWRRCCGLMPVQFCVVCGKWYWAGFPRLWFDGWTWQPWWMEYCSRACADEELERLDSM